ncbi:MAG: class I SAM-dependent methyltransferase, partial [Candidatus Methylomirabilis sp.]|nr:class I SAM-dependent methyltransferase [Deltaproteobacteria bacterium]
MKGRARFICPACRGALAFENDGTRCTECGRDFPTSQGYADFTLGERFLDDRENPGLWDIEERTGRHLAEQYLQGLLTRLFPDRPRSEIRVLSIGCGVGSDVEALCDLGFDAYGIDPGGRTELWKRRPHSDRYFLANAKKLPFPDGDFDFAFLCCVLTHIGTVGSSGNLQPDFEAQRAEAAGEAARVVRHDGYVMLSGPNPRFPLDLWHRPNLHSPRPRVHRPGERFCLALPDYRSYLLK